MTASTANKTENKAAPAMPEAGVAAPTFTVTDDQGNTRSLAEFSGKAVILYFYPKDDTPGCTTEAKDFRDLYPEFQKAGAEVLGISKDSVKSHDKFKCKYELTFPLLSDESGAICDSYGTWVEKSMYGKKYMGIQRATFLIDKTGVIRQVWPKVSVTNHAADVLKAVKAL